MEQDQDKWNFNFNREEEIMMWALVSEIYFKHYQDIDNFQELRDKYMQLWDEPDRKPIIKRAIKYFYLFRRAVIEKGDKGDAVGLLFESRTQLTQSDVDFYYDNITNSLSLLLLDRIVENGGSVNFADNIILHLGAGSYYPRESQI